MDWAEVRMGKKRSDRASRVLIFIGRIVAKERGETQEGKSGKWGGAIQKFEKEDTPFAKYRKDGAP